MVNLRQTEKPIDPLISIITPAYNAEKFIGETIKSVLNQTYENWELIIVDDYSIDKTIDIVASFQHYDPRIKLIRLKKNSGPAIARNTAIDVAKGRFIAFLDSDDLWLSDKLEKQLQFMLHHDIAFSFTKYMKMKEDGTETGSVIDVPASINYNGLLKHCVIGCLTVMLDTEKTGKVKMINMRNRQDYVLWLNLTKVGFVAYGLPEILAKYRLVKNSISSNKIKMAKRNWYVYRKVEKQSIIKSAWYFSHYFFYKLKQVININNKVRFKSLFLNLIRRCN